MENDHQIGLVILKFKILFTLMLNYMIFLTLLQLFKNYMFKINLYIFIKIQSNLQTPFILNIYVLSQWHAKYTNELWFFS
jgi:hypothetical protein